MILGVDASNIRDGGGVTHLKNLLRFAEPERFGIKKIIVWGGKDLLGQLSSRTWLDLREVIALNRSLLCRLYWQNMELTSLVRKNCDLLFVPGGLYLGSFRPYVAMCQNLLPFVDDEIARYGFSGITIRMKMLALGQAHTFAHADGIIFLTRYVRDLLLSKYYRLDHVRNAVIPHGIDPIFWRYNVVFHKPTVPIRLLYVSRVDLYKHQWKVVSAVSILRNQGFDIHLTLVGSAYYPALEKLNTVMKMEDNDSTFTKYLGPIDYDDLPFYYHNTDLFIFASTCETLGIILLEAMASQLPIACSSRQPMPEVLGDAGVYFDPEDVTSITIALRKLLISTKLRKVKAKMAKEHSGQYLWQRCADDTFHFLSASI